VFYDRKGNPLSLNGTLRDITEQKKEEQRKDDFIGMVSHELKTPLTSLKAYLQILQRMDLLTKDPMSQNMLGKSVKQVQYMNTMINGFLNVSRLDSGQLHLVKTVFDFQSLFAEIEDEVLSTIKTHHFLFQASGKIMIHADREKIAQVLHNLVGNAVKYSPIRSTIRVDYSANDNSLKVNVQDLGKGIAEEDQQRIFERYYRVKENTGGLISGFGIGLYLCREIIELHNGTIQVQSVKDEGSIFSFTLPFNP
jgi:two-component system sensor histidine kinase VicK